MRTLCASPDSYMYTTYQKIPMMHSIELHDDGQQLNPIAIYRHTVALAIGIVCNMYTEQSTL